jgi:hypothetical protein
MDARRMTARLSPIPDLEEEARLSYASGLDDGARISGVAPANDASLRGSMRVPAGAGFQVVPAAQLRLSRLLWMPSKNVKLRFRMLAR